MHDKYRVESGAVREFPPRLKEGTARNAGIPLAELYAVRRDTAMISGFSIRVEPRAFYFDLLVPHLYRGALFFYTEEYI